MQIKKIITPPVTFIKLLNSGLNFFKLDERNIETNAIIITLIIIFYHGFEFHFINAKTSTQINITQINF